MKKIITILSLMMLVTTFNVYADNKTKHTVMTGCVSYHFDRSAGYNENNLCIGYKNEDNLFGMAFINSENDPVVMAGHDFTVGKFLGLDAGFIWGVAVGYERYNVMPVIAPKVDFELIENLKVKSTLLLFEDPAISFNLEYTF